MSVLKIIGSQKPMQSKQLGNQNQAKEFLPVENEEKNPNRTDQRNFHRQLFGKPRPLRPAILELVPELGD